jgi:TRL-like protein family
MKRIMHVVVATMAVLILSGCVYSHVLTPYDTDLNKTVLGQKQGKASMESVLWLIAWGDASTAAAAKQGGLTTVNHMDRETLFVLFGLYSKSTTIVYGD